MLINAVVLKEAKDSSEIENIIISSDELYEALSSNKSQTNSEIKEVVNYRRSIQSKAIKLLLPLLLLIASYQYSMKLNEDEA